MNRILYFDCFSGISGDMTIGALLDLGIDRNLFLEQLKKIHLEGYQIEITNKSVNGINGTDFKVIFDSSSHSHDHHGHHSHHPHSAPHRNLSDIEAIIETCDLKKTIKTLAKTIFREVALSEAKVHGKPLNEIHFHEVGAVDSIVDILGTAICIEMIQPDRVVSSPLPVGSGTINCAHGTIPLPAPATMEILKGVPVYSNGAQGELVTPTGAAIIKTLADEFIPFPSMTVEKIGYGTGKNTYELPNLLRVFQGSVSSVSLETTDQLILLETNIDDLNPEIYSYLLPKLFQHGALDAYLTHLIMKKGRPGVMLSVLCQPDKAAVFKDILYRETTTLGIRSIAVCRDRLIRKEVMLQTRFGPVRAKTAFLDGARFKTAPEYEECRRIATETDLPLREIYAILLAECNTMDH